jgi:hypothetical protein
VPVIGPAAAAQHRHGRQQRAERAMVGASSSGSPVSSVSAASSSTWLSFEALARRPPMHPSQIGANAVR